MLTTIPFAAVWPELQPRPADESVTEDDRAADAALVAELRRCDLGATQELPIIEDAR